MSGWGVGGRHGALCSCDDAVNVNQRLQCSALEVWGWSSVVSGRWLCVSVWEGGQRGLVYQLHSDTLSKALCVLPLRESCCEPPHGSAFMHDDSHMPHRSPMLPSAPLLSSPVAKDELTTSYFTNRWGFGSKHHFNVFLSWSHLLLSICKPIRGLLTNSCIVEVRPRGKIFFLLRFSWFNCDEKWFGISVSEAYQSESKGSLKTACLSPKKWRCNVFRSAARSCLQNTDSLSNRDW